MPTKLHRCYGAGYLHFITTSCYRRSVLHGTPQNRDLFLEVMEQVRGAASLSWCRKVRTSPDRRKKGVAG